MGLGEAFLVDLDPAPAMGISATMGRGSARTGTGGNTSAMWMPAPSVRSLDLPLDQDIILLRHASNNYWTVSKDRWNNKPKEINYWTVRFGKDNYYKLDEIKIHFKETTCCPPLFLYQTTILCL